MIEKDISVQAISCHGAPVSKTFSSSDTGNGARAYRVFPLASLQALLSFSSAHRPAFAFRSLGGTFVSNKSRMRTSRGGAGMEARQRPGVVFRF